MKRARAVAAKAEDGLVEVELEDGRLVTVIFDEFGIPHAGRKLTTLTESRHIVEMILPYDVRVIGTIGADPE